MASTTFQMYYTTSTNTHIFMPTVIYNPNSMFGEFCHSVVCYLCIRCPNLRLFSMIITINSIC